MKKNILLALTIALTVFSNMAFAQSTDCEKSANKNQKANYTKNNTPDIVDTAISAGNFKTLIAAVKVAGLVDALRGDNKLTVFAPTDEAFARLPEGTIQMLLKPENKHKLIKILTYHVVSGELNAETVLSVRKLKTLEGSALNVRLKSGAAFINTSKILKTDIVAGNGVIHVIDTVLLPE